MNNDLMFSKKSDEWSTPDTFWNGLNRKYDFRWDLACSKENCKVGVDKQSLTCGFTIEDNALVKDWAIITKWWKKEYDNEGWLWLNPPYSMCKEFTEKAYHEMLSGAKIVMLIPARTDTRYFHEWIYKKKGIEIEFIKGRLKFGDSKNAAPFPSMLVIFNNE